MNPMETWAGMELNTKGDIIIAVVQASQGQNNQKSSFMKICAYNVPGDSKTQELTPIFAKAFDQPILQRVQMMRKVKGYDIYVIGCKNNILIVAWSGQDFSVLNVIQNINNGLIFDCVVYGNILIPITTDASDTIKVISFNQQEFDREINMEKKNKDSELNMSVVKQNVLCEQNISMLVTPPISGTKKIAISKDGRTIFFGGDSGLVIMKRQDLYSPFLLFKKDTSISYYGLRSTPSGYFVVQHHKSNTLAVYDKKGMKKADFQGERKDSGYQLINREPHFSFEGDQMMWFGGITSLYIVDLNNLTQIKIDNFVHESLSGNPP